MLQKNVFAAGNMLALKLHNRKVFLPLQCTPWQREVTPLPPIVKPPATLLKP